ncbi:apoptosis facilitator Bcl-2-like protein 14 [Ahaetulla prasina]|uniref:apoptosis facilitator Bcl-2-like protein 14 n=1 Tax=Ahaetulla prasina TaxID=499056 RepID=UPI0026485D26|nr:apoptosis facilitator Bcl-2-like protein 14 [Ahaetulla prasina]XP_058046656.1 apoptosis facilitator Bcl-2-like protein 14 [Ahaetulla prasina]XP_058046657.1 apoptosis facilitator Bcl-2-like protein 14 [Ahaetulla prasina]XP_058046659.1 apoptosis facilitator Bcl-2-like protein 14 [Ahaetulla prasina]XP_058046660.1 apoptosis facilitator Bcl-2-like protein 14 [Ahaetulla prasina]
MNNEHHNGLANMEEIPLEDTDRSSVEFRVLMVYAQRRLSVSKYGQILERKPGIQEERREVVQADTLAKGGEVTVPEISPEDHKPPKQKEQKKTKKKKKAKTKTRTNWKCFCIPSCLRLQARDARNQGSLKPDSINGHAMKVLTRVEGLPDDSYISCLADRLVEIVDRSRFPDGKKNIPLMERALSLEEDGGSTSKPIPPAAVDGLDDEEKVIDAIVALLRKSGDELTEKMKKDKTFCQSIWDMMTSYAFFRRVTDQFLEEMPIDSTMNSEDEVKSMKVALIMEATTRLTAVDNHPMNLVLGFGTKYLQENFSPWIQSRGGWLKALGLPDQEEVE